MIGNSVRKAKHVEAINIPSSVTYIHSWDSNNGVPFYNTLSLKSITFAPNSQLTRIAPFAFQSSGIEEIQFPASLVMVNQNLFRGCTSLRVIRFGENFQGFENVDRNGNIATGHQSLTHTVSALKEVYLPASFYASKPSVNYRVSYAFDGGSNVKYFFTGTEEQLVIAKANFTNSEWTTGATDHNYKFLNANVISWETYSQDKDAYANGNYVIYGYNYCDAFHGGEHKVDTYVSYDDLTKEGERVTGCTREECGYGTSEALPALFQCLGYSASESGNAGLILAFKVNHEAIDNYKTETGNALEYGMFAVLKSNIGENGILNADGSENAGVIKADLTKNQFAVVSIKVKGFTNDEQKDAQIALGLYVIVDGEEKEISYYQSGTPDEGEKFASTSYNQQVSVAE